MKFYNIDLFCGELASAEGIQTQLNSFIPAIEKVGTLLFIPPCFLPLESQPLHAFLRKAPFWNASFNIQSIVMLSPNDYVSEVSGILVWLL